jgi:phage tail tube protein FII
MAIPKKLRLFTMFVDGDNYIGKIPVTLPKLPVKRKITRVAGCLAPLLSTSALIQVHWMHQWLLAAWSKS